LKLNLQPTLIDAHFIETFSFFATWLRGLMYMKSSDTYESSKLLVLMPLDIRKTFYVCNFILLTFSHRVNQLDSEKAINIR